MLKGVLIHNTVHVYGNDITQIVLAEKKIKSQAGEIQESIQYASRIQHAMLPGSDTVKRIFPNHFIFYRPKNIVSGEFYWVNKLKDLQIVAVADSTGHGVPGAFMSMMGVSLLNEIVLRDETSNPAFILNTLRERLIQSLKSEGSISDVADGIDISLAVIDNKNKSLLFAGAYNPLYIIRNGELHIIEAERMPVGKFINDKVPFSEKTVKIQSKDRLILFSDGYKDQYGGEKNKKYSSRRFKELLIRTSTMSISEQAKIIEEEFEKWKSDIEQIDDVLVMGIEIV